MYKVYCYPLNESTVVKNKIEAIKVYRKYYNEMLELICNSDKRWTAKDISTFIEYSTDCINVFTNGSKKFYLTVGMGICPIHKISIKNLEKIYWHLLLDMDNLRTIAENLVDNFYKYEEIINKYGE